MAFDLAKTEVLERLLAQPDEARGQAWVEEFQQAAPDASMAAAEPQVQAGPDGFPYFRLMLPPIGEAFSSFSVNHVLEVCTDNGFGCALFGRGDSPPWVLRYGDLWSLRAEGVLYTRPFGVEPRLPPPGVSLFTGQPSESVMPDWARAVLRRWLAQHDVEGVGMVMVVDAEGYEGQDAGYGGSPAAYWLSFSLFAEDFEDPAKFDWIVNRLTWFMPGRFSVLNAPPGTFDYEPL